MNKSVRRVLMTGDAIGGVWTFNLELARALGDHGIEVVLASMGGCPSGSQRADAARISNLRLYHSEFKLEWMCDPWRDVEVATDWLLAMEARFAPDVIHLNSYGPGDAAWSAPVVLTAHSCVKSWWRAVHAEEAPGTWKTYADRAAAAVGRAWMVTAPTAFMLDSVERDYGPLRRGLVIPHGRSAAHFCARQKEPIILSAGRLWDRAKNVETLACIARSAGWPVCIAGSLQDPEGSTRQFAGCRELGRLSTTALADWFGRASIYALPARYEPFGLTALEAALSECALVLGDIPSLRETWDGAAVFVPPDDTRAWRKELQSLIADGARRASLAKLARARAAEFSDRRMAAAYAECYARAVQPAGAACG